MDIEFVPSATTRTQLLSYLEKIALKVPEVKVVPYPVDPRLGERLTDKEWLERRQQLADHGKTPLKLMVPVSGAAVQLSFIKDLLLALPQKGEVMTTVVAREANQTHEFLDWCQDFPSVTVAAHWLDRRVVEIYEEQMEREIFDVEVTKPSEQAFKVLLTPKQRGGVIMLFSEPVGRQEDDNLMFMRRHGLLPSLEDQAKISQILDDRSQMTDEILKKARKWRGLMLPEDGSSAGRALWQFKQSGLLAAMGDFSGFMPGHAELASDGVKRIWEVLSGLI